MKLLMIFSTHFAYSVGDRSLASAEASSEEREAGDAVVGFIHAEEADEQAAGRVETKLVKNLKWAARKNDTRRIVLHSFSHLAETKAAPEFTQELLSRAERRLEEAGYEVCQTPFGHFLNLDICAPGRSAARIFAQF